VATTVPSGAKSATPLSRASLAAYASRRLLIPVCRRARSAPAAPRNETTPGNSDSRLVARCSETWNSSTVAASPSALASSRARAEICTCSRASRSCTPPVMVTGTMLTISTRPISFRRSDQSRNGVMPSPG